MQSINTHVIKTVFVQMGGERAETISAAALYRAGGKTMNHEAWFRNYIKKLGLVRERDYVFDRREPGRPADGWITIPTANRIILSMRGLATDPVLRLGGYEVAFYESERPFARATAPQVPAPVESVSRAIVPVVKVKDGRVFADSRDVADVFGKRHNNVLRAVQDLDCSREFSALNFEPATYIDSLGYSRPSVEMTRDGFSFLVMGFTGSEAAHWKELYITAFNQMEAKLRVGPALGPMGDDDLLSRAVLLAIRRLESATKEIAALTVVVEAQKPKAVVYDNIAAIRDAVTLTDAAKDIGISRTILIQWMIDHGWLFKKSTGDSNRAIESKLKAGLMTHKVETIVDRRGNERVTIQARVTPRGIIKLREELQRDPFTSTVLRCARSVRDLFDGRAA